VTGDLPTEASEEPLASCDAAFSCLLQLGGRSGGNEVGAVHCRNVVNGETLSVSRLIELAGDLGLKAEYARLDWQRLQVLRFSRPILVLLKNTNVIVLTGGGRGEAAEVAVWDPLDPYKEILFVPRMDFERAWTGHALIITAPPSNGAGTSPSPDFCWFTSAGLELLGKTSVREQNPKLLVQRQEEADTLCKPAARRMPRQTDPAVAPAAPGELALARVELANEQVPPDAAKGTQPSAPALPRTAAERRLSPLVRLGIAVAGILAAAGIGTFVLRNSATDLVTAAMTPVKEVWAVASEGAQSTDRRIASSPRTGSAPIPTAPSATPVDEHSLAAAPATPAAEPDVAARSAEPTPPDAEPAAPTLAATPTAPPDEPDVAAPPAEPGLATPARAPDAKTAAPSAPTSGSRLSAGEMAALLARGDTLLSVGDVASARLFYERAVDAGGGLAAIRLGETFDPLFLDRVHLSGVRGDPGVALFWYRRARDLGATDAEVLLKALEAK
jgi:hypothetical protein